MSDQHNANTMRCAGHPDVRTQNLDQLAARGTRFTRAYCNSPICGPSRSCFLTGQYVKTHGISGNFIRAVNFTAPNLASHFRRHGYQTALVGKAHLPAKWVNEGFEHVRLSDLADADTADPRTCHYFQDLVNAGLADDYDQGTLFSGHPGYNLRSFISKLPESHSLESWTGRQAREFLAQRDSDRPFFLKVSFQRPHDPYAPPAERSVDYVPQDLKLPGNAGDFLENRLKGKPQFQRQYAKGRPGGGYPFLPGDAEDLKLQMSRHFTLITMIDDAIGGILSALESSGDLDNTLVVYVADHGDFAGEHGMVLKNLGIYESIHRIPFIIAGPGIPRGASRQMLIESVDFFPTLAELAGIPCLESLDGTSRVAEINGDGAGLDSSVCEWDYQKNDSTIHAVRTVRYRYVCYDFCPQDGELYDHKTDPGEMKNLFNHPGYQNVVKELQCQVDHYRMGSIRRHVPADDRRLTFKLADEPTIRIHQKGKCWSDLLQEGMLHSPADDKMDFVS